jgi:transposase
MTPSAAELASMVSALQAELVGLKSHITEGQTQIASLRETVLNLTHENELLKRRIYGNKTERTQTSELQLALGNLLDDEKRLQKQLNDAVAAARSGGGDGDEASSGTPKTKPAPKGRRDLSVSNLPRFLLEICDEDLEQTCKRIGFEESHQLMFRRGGFWVLVKRTAKYEVAGKDGTTVLGVEAPKTLFPRGLLHSSVVAHLLVQKFAIGVPFNRLEQHFTDQGLDLDRSIMCRYADEAGGALGATVVHAMWQRALSSAFVISTDATSGMIQPEKGQSSLRQACKKGHFFTAVADCDYVLFAYTEKHTQEFVKKLFGGFKGYLQSDASNVYDILERGPPADVEDDVVKLVGCWAHCRRYFFEAAICKYPVGLQGLMRIRAIYAIDDSFRKLPPIKRKTMRDEHVRPLMDGFFQWARDARADAQGRNLPTKALGYALNQEAELRRVLADARLPLDNTRSERSLRKIVVGRKNWMFYGSDGHAESAAATSRSSPRAGFTRSIPSSTWTRSSAFCRFWPRERYLQLAPHNWTATRAKLDPDELDAPLCSFTIPPA